MTFRQYHLFVEVKIKGWRDISQTFVQGGAMQELVEFYSTNISAL